MTLPAKVMAKVTAADFANAFGQCKEKALRGPVATTSHGQVSGYLVSTREYEELQRLKAFERSVYRIKDLPAEVAKAAQNSKMNPCHDHLNTLLGDKQNGE